MSKLEREFDTELERRIDKIEREIDAQDAANGTNYRWDNHNAYCGWLYSVEKELSAEFGW